MMREKYGAIDHQFDIWHIAKGTTKKVNSKPCEELRPWMKPISNRFWWSAETCGGNTLQMKVQENVDIGM